MEQNPNTVNETVETAVATVNPSAADSMIAHFAANKPAFYCSFVPASDADKAALYNAINNPDVQLADHIGKEIVMRDVIIQPVEVISEATKEAVTAPRVTIIDMEGNTYSCVSQGIYNALSTLVQVFGEPRAWKNGLRVTVRQITRGTRRIFTLDAAV